MLKRIIALVLLSCLLTDLAAAQTKNDQLLQLVSSGSFATFDPEDGLSVRVYSAVLPQVLAVSDSDIADFSREQGVDENALRLAYYTALKHCVWAHILQETDLRSEHGKAHQVLLLFIDPASQPNADMQMAAIRASLTEPYIARLAEVSGLPADFITWLICGEEGTK